MLAEVIVKAAGMELEERGAYYPRPSSAGPERCIRQMVYHAIHAVPYNERAKPDRLVLVLNDSSWHEELTGDWLNRTAFRLHSRQMAVDCAEMFWRDPAPRKCETCSKQQEKDVFVPGNIIHGHIDGVITDLNLVDYHYEHKAISHFKFQEYWADKWPLDYITQCCLYQKGLKDINSDITKTVMLVKNKNTAQYLDFLIEYDVATDEARMLEVGSSIKPKKVGEAGQPLVVFPNILKDALGKFAEVDRCVAEDILPDRQYDFGHWRCDYCDWKTTCEMDYDAEITSFTEKAELSQEFEDLGRYYLETNLHIKEMTEEKDQLRNKIISLMDTLEVKSGKAGPYSFNHYMTVRKLIDKDKIPKAILEEAQYESKADMLRITKKKEKEA
jgi:hypothetical protein